MNRIDAGKVPDVFRRLKLKPVSSAFVGDIARNECCVLTAIYCDARGCTDPRECLSEVNDQSEVFNTNDFLADRLEADGDYVEGVIDGWDDPDRDQKGCDVYSGRFMDGREDGALARRAMRMEGFDVDEFCDDDDDEDEDDLVVVEDDDWDDEDCDDEGDD